MTWLMAARRTRRLVAVAVIAAAFAVPLIIGQSLEPVDLQAIYKIKEEGLQRSKVMDIASYLTDVYGPRLTGSPNIRAAGDWAVKEMQGWGLTNVEAEACATPVVASNSPGIRESVRDGETGFLVPYGDVEGMTAAFRRLAASRDLVTSMGAKARAFAETFTWERAASRTEAHLARVIQPGG